MRVKDHKFVFSMFFIGHVKIPIFAKKSLRDAFKCL